MQSRQEINLIHGNGFIPVFEQSCIFRGTDGRSLIQDIADNLISSDNQERCCSSEVPERPFLSFEMQGPEPGFIFQRFPSLDPDAKRNSSKRRKRDKKIPIHQLSTMTEMNLQVFKKLPKIKYLDKPKKIPQNEPIYALSSRKDAGNEVQRVKPSHTNLATSTTPTEGSTTVADDEGSVASMSVVSISEEEFSTSPSENKSDLENSEHGKKRKRK